MKKFVVTMLLVCMMVAAASCALGESAHGFTESIGHIPSAPEVAVGDGDGDGDDEAAEGEARKPVILIRDSVTHEIVARLELEDLIITSVADLDNPQVSDEVRNALQWAYDLLRMTDDCGELPSDTPEGNLFAQFYAMFDEMGIDMETSALVVKDLFHVSVSEEFLHYLHETDDSEDHYLEVTFKANVDPNGPMFVLECPDYQNWNIAAQAEYTVKPNGNVTVRLHDVGLVAFLIEMVTLNVEAEGAVTAP